MGDNVFGGSGNDAATLEKHNAMMQDRRSREVLSDDARKALEEQKAIGLAMIAEENAIKEAAKEAAKAHASAKIVQLPSAKMLETVPEKELIIPDNVKVTKLASKGEGKRRGGGGNRGPRE